MKKFALYFISLLRTISSITTDNSFQYLLKNKYRCVFLCRSSFLWLIMPLLQASTCCFIVKVNGVLYLSFQAPVFISFFIALRKMAYLPVPSLQTGGLLWFPDLTAADPFYILPLAVTGTMVLILEVGHPKSGEFLACGNWLDMSS